MNNLTSVITDFLQQNADATRQGNHGNRRNFTEVTDKPNINQSSSLGNQSNRKNSGNPGAKPESKTDESSWPELFDYFKEVELRYSPMNLTCSGCNHFIPDQVGDGTGIGKCAIAVKRSVLLWPRQTACSQAQVLGVSQ